MISLFFTNLLMIFIAEMGDKTQLLTMTFASKYKPKQILLGISIALFLLNLLSVLAGKLIADYFPLHFVKTGAGIMFLLFAVLSFRNDEEEKAKQFRLPPVLSVAFAFFLAELGDKTQITSMANASSACQAGMLLPLVIIFVSSFLALFLANWLALYVSEKLMKRLPENIFRNTSVIVFIFFGVTTLYHALNCYESLSSNMVMLLTLGSFLLTIIFSALLYKSGLRTKKCR